ncbi:restriction endonuclease subunit S domain-containing protein [Priestia megaterium]|uniref:hypothetical protein n=1 Tax=Priestia megaterium TaxID=1404 RepID=UPI00300B32B1
MNSFIPSSWVGKSYRLDAEYYALEELIRKEIQNRPYVLLKELCEQLTDGTRQIRSFVDEGIPYLRIANLSPPFLNEKKLKYVSLNEEIEEKAIVRRRDLLISKTGRIGRVVIVGEDFDGAVIGPDLVKLRLKDPTHVEWVFEFLNSRVGQWLLEQAAPVTLITKISLKELADLRVALPAERDVMHLEDLKEKHRKIEKLKKQLDAYYRVSIDRYEDEEKLPAHFFVSKNEITNERIDFQYYQRLRSKLYTELEETIAHEEWISLDTVATIKRRSISIDKQETEINYISFKSIKQNAFVINDVEITPYEKVKNRARFPVREKDVLLGVVGPYIGTSKHPLAIVMQSLNYMIASSTLAVICAEEISPFYLIWCLNHPLVRFQLRIEKRGQWQQMISMKNIGQLKIPNESIEIQTKIVDLMEKFINLQNDVMNLER